MALDDLPLHHSSSDDRPAPPPERGPSLWRWVGVAGAGVIVGGLLTFWWMSRVQPSTAPPAATMPTEAAVGPSRPARQPLDLPPLDDSDTLLRGLVSTLSGHPTLARLLATQGLLRGMVLAVVQIADGRTPASPLRSLRPGSRLEVQPATGRLAASSYARWNAAAGALTSVSPRDAAQLYVNIKPLVDQAYRELGHPDGNFDTAITRAIRMLDSTPAVATEPVLIRRPNYFEHEDLTLRALPPVQKQFLLIGPENRRAVLNWLHEFAAILEIRLD